MKTPEEIEKLALLIYPEVDSDATLNFLRQDARMTWVKGYIQCQQDNVNKKYTEEDIRKAFFNGGIDLASNQSDDIQFNEFIKSLNK